MPEMRTYPNLDRRIALLEPGAATKNELGESVPGDPVEHPRWAARRDITGRERLRAGTEFTEQRTRFVIRWDSKVRPGWRLRDEYGREHEIEGLVEIGRRRYLELLAARNQ